MFEELRYHWARFGILLVMVALVVGIAGCGIIAPAQYSITISSTVGGAVTEPGEGLFRFPAGSVVNLVADPDRGYTFFGWTTNADSIADVHDATTTIIVNKNYCFVTANFVE